jgi:hypothetical protein
MFREKIDVFRGKPLGGRQAVEPAAFPALPLL